MTLNPNLHNVDPDPEGCPACAESDWPCAYHAGFDAGADWARNRMLLAVEPQ